MVGMEWERGHEEGIILWGLRREGIKRVGGLVTIVLWDWNSCLKLEAALAWSACFCSLVFPLPSTRFFLLIDLILICFSNALDLNICAVLLPSFLDSSKTIVNIHVPWLFVHVSIICLKQEQRLFNMCSTGLIILLWTYGQLIWYYLIVKISNYTCI